MNPLLKLRKKLAPIYNCAVFHSTNKQHSPSHRHFIAGKAAALKLVLASIDGRLYAAHDKKHDRRKQ